MILFQFSAWHGGPNLLSAGLYSLDGWHIILLFPLDCHAILLRLPVRARMYR